MSGSSKRNIQGSSKSNRQYPTNSDYHHGFSKSMMPSSSSSDPANTDDYFQKMTFDASEARRFPTTHDLSNHIIQPRERINSSYNDSTHAQGASDVDDRNQAHSRKWDYSNDSDQKDENNTVGQYQVSISV
ncbi:uncharacterized protein L201_007210 [Kwoniella dendrophila CBS 6074]|uniref:Uncharacterized protein n=1 Tax=Kwoniella dendrophila CBS 6074 TaxID=1295534 RepID=A0AAX4K3T6_9TREE